jgi:hypothetical protein
MTEKDRRFWELSAEAKAIGATPDVGEPEVRRLAEILAEMTAIYDDTPAGRLAKCRERMHMGRGRAVDWTPPSLLDKWLKRPY